jgi:hypothetical protein
MIQPRLHAAAFASRCMRFSRFDRLFLRCFTPATGNFRSDAGPRDHHLNRVCGDCPSTDITARPKSPNRTEAIVTSRRAPTKRVRTAAQVAAPPIPAKTTATLSASDCRCRPPSPDRRRVPAASRRPFSRVAMPVSRKSGVSATGQCALSRRGPISCSRRRTSTARPKVDELIAASTHEKPSRSHQ